MKADFTKTWRTTKSWWTLGIALYDWALPVQIEFLREPNSYESWNITLTVLVFYVNFCWAAGPDLADRMTQALKEL